MPLLGARTAPMRADIMLAGVFIPACWSEDQDRDIIVMDRSGAIFVIYRKDFTELGSAI
jgi:hypothetical protein